MARNRATRGAATTAAFIALMVVISQLLQSESRLFAQHTQAASTQLGESDQRLIPRYRPPIDAEIVDFFRPPAHVGAPGNRGLEYTPAPGQNVRASAEGTVVFAGTVVANKFVTVQHSDGLRTSYGYLGWIAVSKGDWVTAGQVVGTTTSRFFFSVRAGDTYLDPVRVLTTGRVRLVPPRHFDRHQSRLSGFG